MKSMAITLMILFALNTHAQSLGNKSINVNWMSLKESGSQGHLYDYTLELVGLSDSSSVAVLKSIDTPIKAGSFINPEQETSVKIETIEKIISAQSKKDTWGYGLRLSVVKVTRSSGVSFGSQIIPLSGLEDHSYLNVAFDGEKTTTLFTIPSLCGGAGVFNCDQGSQGFPVKVQDRGSVPAKAELAIQLNSI